MKTNYRWDDTIVILVPTRRQDIKINEKVNK
jgi:hypothetical protein